VSSRPRRSAGLALAGSLAAAVALTASASSAESDRYGPDGVDYEAALAEAGEIERSTSPATEGLSTRLAALSGADLRDASNRKQADAVSLRAHGAGSLLRDDGRLVVSARVSEVSDDPLERLRAAGAEVLGAHPEFGTVDLAVAEGDLRAVAAVAGVEALTEALEPLVAGASAGARLASPAPTPLLNACTGSLVSEADTQLHAAEARAAFDIDGAGTKVGVISDSYDTRVDAATRAAQDVATGDLPGPGNPCKRRTPVQVLSDEANGIDEGRAMSQLVHDVAPGAAIAFATRGASAEAMADAIRGLKNAGSTVIVDDITFFDEPMYQDGPISVAVNEVTAAGVPYYSSAANSNVISQVPGGVSGTTGQNISSFEATGGFRNGGSCLGPGSTCMDFNPGGAVDPSSSIILGAGRSVTLIMGWGQARGAVNTDFDVRAFDQATATLIGAATDNNLASQKPFEVLRFENPTGSARLIDIVINRFAGSAAPRVKYVMLGAGGVLGAEYDVSLGSDVVGPTIFGHNGAENAVSTAAVPFDNAGVLETFSSRGPVTMLFGPVGATPAAPLPAPQVLAKPDISATDNTVTTFFQPLGDGTFRFSGTSAAAPHAAAVAALQQDAANGALSVAQVRAAQNATASPVGFFGVNAAGAGLVNAAGAVSVNPPKPPIAVITKAPKNKTPKSKVTYKFASNAAEATFSCKIDRGRFQKCASPVKVKRIPFGRHVFSVKAKANGLTGAATKDKFKRTR
jgi:hypothetical protein